MGVHRRYVSDPAASLQRLIFGCGGSLRRIFKSLESNERRPCPAQRAGLYPPHVLSLRQDHVCRGPISQPLGSEEFLLTGDAGDAHRAPGLEPGRGSGQAFGSDTTAGCTKRGGVCVLRACCGCCVCVVSIVGVYCVCVVYVLRVCVCVLWVGVCCAQTHMNVCSNYPKT